MTAVVFETPGLIDLRAFTIMGAHAKPNSSNPIGFFGTGLKYAIAVLVRLGAEPVAWVGEDRLSFAARKSKFRGSDLETIRMSVLRKGNRRPTSYELPFTTRYGARWDVWMAFRELESNTRDERGRTYTVDTRCYGDARLERDSYSIDELVRGAEGTTRIVVDLPAFAEVAEKIDEVFLPRGSRGAPGTILEAFDGESDVAFYRTMRAMDLKKPSTFTYNFVEELALTEDRTIKHEFYARDALARWVLSSATEEQVEAILTADEDRWEHGLDFPARVRPSAAFEAVMRRRPKGISRGAWAYYGAYAGQSRKARDRGPWRLADAHPRPWRVEDLEVLDRDGNPIFAAPEGYYEDWDRTAEAIVARINLLDRLPRREERPALPPGTPEPAVEEAALEAPESASWPF